VRVLVAQPGPAFSVQDVYAGWVEALRELGCQVVGFNLGERLTFYEAALMPTQTPDVFRKAVSSDQATELAVNGLHAALYKVRPDVLLVISGFYIPPEIYHLARAYGTQVVIIHTEEPYEHDREMTLAPYADLHILNDPTNLHDFDDAIYIPHCYRPSLHHPGPPVDDMVCDLAFVGTGYPSRTAFFEAMNLDGVDTVLAGNWEHLDRRSPLAPLVGHELDQCMDNETTADLYRSARVGINVYRREATAGGSALGWAMGPREIEMAACGLFFVRDPRGEGDLVLDMLPSFTGPEHASDLVRWWLAHPEERAETALKARAAVDDRTFNNAAAAVLRLLEG